MLLSNKHAFLISLLAFFGTAQAEIIAPITNCADLRNISDYMAGHYMLTQDIDCVGVEFHPIGSSSGRAFTGTLDGENPMGGAFVIRNLSIESAGLPVGLFVSLEGRVSNIHFQNAEVKGAHDQNVGLIAAQADGAEISNITVDTLTLISPGHGNEHAAGGIVGYAENTTLSHVRLYSTHKDEGISIANLAPAGGLIGIANTGTQIIASSVEQLKPGKYFCIVEDCAFGGLIGVVENTFLAEQKVTISRSFARGSIETGKNGGGLIGRVEPYAYVDIDNSYAQVRISEVNQYGGGLIGQAKELINGPRGNITLTHVYAAGRIDDGRGIVGNYDKSSPRVKSVGSFFDKEATGRKYSGDRYTAHDENNKLYQSIGFNTAAMQSRQTYIAAGWDETIWDLPQGSAYPTLK